MPISDRASDRYIVLAPVTLAINVIFKTNRTLTAYIRIDLHICHTVGFQPEGSRIQSLVAEQGVQVVKCSK